MLYRPTYYQDEKVYEIVSDYSGDGAAGGATSSSLPDSDQYTELKLESPYLRGDRVRKLQTALQGIGFNVGRIDGIFGRATDTAVRAFQEWYSLPVTGVVDYATASGIAAEYTVVLAPPPVDAGSKPEDAETEATSEPASEESAATAEEPATAVENDLPVAEEPAASDGDGDGASAEPTAESEKQAE